MAMKEFCLIAYIAFECIGFGYAAEPKENGLDENDKAWVILESPGDANTNDLANAVSTIVGSEAENDMIRLAEAIESEPFLKAFAYPEPINAPIEMHPFSKLMDSVASCGSTRSEILLLQLARSKSVTGEMTKGKGTEQTYMRGIAITKALGYIEPKCDETYDLLEKGISGELRISRGVPLRSLIQIGDESAASVLERVLFREEKQWSDENAPVLLQYFGRGRDHKPIMSLLLKWAQEAPSPEIRIVILKVLTSPKSTSYFPDSEPFDFASYQDLTKEEREILLHAVNAIDTKSFDIKSAQVFTNLKKMLASSE
jgi:hypothetical protein